MSYLFIKKLFKEKSLYYFYKKLKIKKTQKKHFQCFFRCFLCVFLGGFFGWVFLLSTLDLGEAAVLVDGDEPDVHELAERLVDFVHLALTIQVHGRQSGNNKKSYSTLNSDQRSDGSSEHQTTPTTIFRISFRMDPHALAFLYSD